MKIVVFWFRRDLRLVDNRGLIAALKSGYPVLPLFIFDDNILLELPPDDARLSFIYQQLKGIHQQLAAQESGLYCRKGDPLLVLKAVLSEFELVGVYANKDYEPYALERDKSIATLLASHNIPIYLTKDQVIFEENEILKQDGQPYTVFTPYKNKWLSKFNRKDNIPQTEGEVNNFYASNFSFPSIESLGFEISKVKVLDYDLSELSRYKELRDIPSEDATSYLSPHLRFGTVSIRQIINSLKPHQDVFLSELIWREFFMQILFHFPKVVQHNFKSKYDKIAWRNNEMEFDLWCQGKTGYPMVDAGMRQLNATGYMHNRVRMVVAGFLCKHLLIDWRWGEAYFASKLLDYDLSANNGNWQWAAGTGCDAAPYFRIFNPITQLTKFDKDLIYVKKWIPEYGTPEYCSPIVEHKEARSRALQVYKAGLLEN